MLQNNLSSSSIEAIQNAEVFMSGEVINSLHFVTQKRSLQLPSQKIEEWFNKIALVKKVQKTQVDSLMDEPILH